MPRAGQTTTPAEPRSMKVRNSRSIGDWNPPMKVALDLNTNRPKVERCVDKALSVGAVAALDDLPGRGRKREITEEARAWLVSLACRKPKELGHARELWTTALLAEHARARCREEGHPSLSMLAKGTVSKILSAQALRPHKVEYFLERRDPDFDRKMAQVPHVYREVKTTGRTETQSFKVSKSNQSSTRSTPR